jgi:hypothetical protein
MSKLMNMLNTLYDTSAQEVSMGLEERDVSTIKFLDAALIVAKQLELNLGERELNFVAFH